MVLARLFRTMSNFDLTFHESGRMIKERLMAKCNRCEADTQLYLRGLPICIKCVEKAELRPSPPHLRTARETDTGKDPKLVTSARSTP
jgi:hypothetical protein